MPPQHMRDPETQGRHTIDEPDRNHDCEPRDCPTKPTRPMQQHAALVQRSDRQGIKQSGNRRQEPPPVAGQGKGPHAAPLFASLTAGVPSLARRPLNNLKREATTFSTESITGRKTL